MPENTLTIKDNRTGQTYTVPIEDGSPLVVHEACLWLRH